MWAITGKRRLVGRLADDEDERRNIVMRVMERLTENDFRRLRRFQETAKPGSSFKAWLATVTTRVAVDYVRSHPESFGRERTERGWVDVRSWQEGDDMRGPRAPDPERLVAAQQLLDRARAELDRDALAALYLWLTGEDFGHIAERVGLEDADAGRRLVRRALKRLRDRHGVGREGESRGTGSS